jgi:hypothetical protein
MFSTRFKGKHLPAISNLGDCFIIFLVFFSFRKYFFIKNITLDLENFKVYFYNIPETKSLGEVGYNIVPKPTHVRKKNP